MARETQASEGFIMRQVLFHIPLHFLGLPDLPIYGYGMMLFLAFVFCAWLAGRLGRREGMPPQLLHDLDIWIFISGIIGARLLYMIRYHERFAWDGAIVWQFLRIWDGGLIFYGAVPGALVGYLLAYRVFLRKHGVSTWKVLDIVAPCAALGLCLGRLGCLLNGCCYGNVACPDCPAVAFPLASPPRFALVERGHQTAAGFVLGPERTVQAVEATAAAQAGLKVGDVILKADDKEILKNADLTTYLHYGWPRGKNDLQLTVRHANGQEETLPAFGPRTLGLHPTQIYESISMALLLWLLLVYFPYRRRDGSVMVLFMFGYGIHRFVNEMLRTDTEKVAFDLTLSQNISVLVLLGAVLLGLWVWLRPLPQPPATAVADA